MAIPSAWYRLSRKIEDAGSYARGDCVLSALQGPDDSFQARLKVYPKGTAQSSYGFVSAFVQLVPPKHLAGSEWSCPGVKLEIGVKGSVNNECQGCLKWDTQTFNQNFDDRGWHDMLPIHNGRRSLWLRGFVMLPLLVAPQTSQSTSFSLYPPEMFSQSPEFVTFRLRESPPIYFDKRLLVARSDYFKEMFSQAGWKEAGSNVIELSNDHHAESRSICAILVFLMSNTFHAGGDEHLAFSVRRLADRYCLTKLVEQAEQELKRLLCAENVLRFLSQVTGSGGGLEAACLRLLEADNCGLLEQQQEKLDQIAEESPELVKQLFRLLLAARGNKRARTG